MQKHSYFSIPVASISIAAALLFVLTSIGSFFDLEIAKAVYLGETPSENLFGILFSFIGIIPTFVCWSFLGASIFCLSRKQINDTVKRRLLISFAVFLCVLSFFYFCNTLYFSNSNVFKIHIVAAYSIGTAVISSSAVLGYTLANKSNDSELLKKALFLAAVSLLTLLIISCTKEIMCRPRFRFVLAMDNSDYFLNWWQNGKVIKSLLASDIVTDEFASFPSGHSAYSMFAIFIFPALGDYLPKLSNFKPFLFALGFKLI